MMMVMALQGNGGLELEGGMPPPFEDLKSLPLRRQS